MSIQRSGNNFIDVNVVDDLSRLRAEQLGISEKSLLAAGRRAANKTARWLQTRVKRLMAGYLETPQKNIKQRVHLRTAKGRETVAYLWIGENPVDPVSLNRKAENIGTGAISGNWYFEGGFEATMPSGKRAIFKRRNRKRLKIDVQMVEVEPVIEANLDRLVAQANRRLQTVTEQEINFELLKANKAVA